MSDESGPGRHKRHPPAKSCTSPACPQCTPHTALRDRLCTSNMGKRVFAFLVYGGVITPERLDELLDGPAEQLRAIDGIGAAAESLLRSPAPPPDTGQRADARRLAAQITAVMHRRSGNGLP